MKRSKSKRRFVSSNGLCLYNLTGLRKLMGMREHEFTRLCSNSDDYYWSFKCKKGEKVRLCVDTRRCFKKALKRLNGRIQDVALPQYLHGGVPGCSNITNAKLHTNRPALVCADIKNFFPSITKSKVKRVFKDELKCSEKVAEVLSEICTFQGVLPTGSPISSSIANLVILRLSARLHGLACKHGAVFSQYVDDITISGPLHIGQLKDLVARIIEECGFTCHPNKLQVYSQSEEHVVTGVRVNTGIDVPAEYLATLKTDIARFRERVQSSSDVSSSEVASLRGRIYYVRELNPGAGRLLLRQFNKLNEQAVGLLTDAA